VQLIAAQALEQAASPTRPALTPGELSPGWNVGNSLRASWPVQGVDRRVEAAVALDKLAGAAQMGVPKPRPVVPALAVQSEYGSTIQPYYLNNCSSLTYTDIAYALPASRYGQDVASHYVQAWLDKYLEPVGGGAWSPVRLERADRLSFYYCSGLAWRRGPSGSHASSRGHVLVRRDMAGVGGC
jgi:hypothetical protein